MWPVVSFMGAGHYRMTDLLPPSTYSVSCSKAGHLSVTKGGIVITAGAVSYASFFLVGQQSE